MALYCLLLPGAESAWGRLNVDGGDGDGRGEHRQSRLTRNASYRGRDNALSRTLRRGQPVCRDGRHRRRFGIPTGRRHVLSGSSDKVAVAVKGWLSPWETKGPLGVTAMETILAALSGPEVTTKLSRLEPKTAGQQEQKKQQH